MKRLFYMIAAVLLLAACKDPAPIETAVTLSLGTSTATVSAETTSASFAVNSNSSWDVTCSDSWVTSYTKNGTGNGTVSISFSANANESSERYADFAVSSGTKTEHFKLIQEKAAQKLYLKAEQTSITVDAKAQTATFTISSNVEWSVSCNSDWIRKYTAKGHDNETIEVEFDPNINTEQDRTASFIITGNQVDQIVLTLIQTKALPGENAKDVTTAQFLEASPDNVSLYRLKGFVTRMISPTYGSIRLEDASGFAMVYCLKTEKGGPDGEFESLDISVGDYIVIVGKRGEFPGGAELVDGYHESHRKVTKVSLADYLTKPDGSNNWFRLKGVVSDINGSSFKITEDGCTVSIKGMLNGIGGTEITPATLGMKNGSVVTIVAPQKQGSTASGVYYESHKNPAVTPGVVARWGFNVNDLAKLGFDKTWTGQTIAVPDLSGDAVEFSTAAGDNGRYIASVDGNGKMTFVQKDKSSNTNSKHAKRIVFYTAQPGVGGVAVDDYFLFEANYGIDIPAGTQIAFSFVLRPNAQSIAYWALEFFDGETWKPFSSLGTHEVAVNGLNYMYNILRSTNDQSLVNASYKTISESSIVKIRIRAAAPIGPDGTIFSSGMSTGDMRFRGEPNFSSPLIEIL